MLNKTEICSIYFLLRYIYRALTFSLSTFAFSFSPFLFHSFFRSPYLLLSLTLVSKLFSLLSCSLCPFFCHCSVFLFPFLFFLFHSVFSKYLFIFFTFLYLWLYLLHSLYFPLYNALFSLSFSIASLTIIPSLLWRVCLCFLFVSVWVNVCVSSILYVSIFVCLSQLYWWISVCVHVYAISI